MKSTCDGDEIILTPLDPNHTEYSFFCEASDVTIFDKTGTSVRHFDTQNPIWDGKNEEGNDLPMGVYFIFCGDSKVAEVTILR
jgi:hypothetical protein